MKLCYCDFGLNYNDVIIEHEHRLATTEDVETGCEWCQEPVKLGDRFVESGYPYWAAHEWCEAARLFNILMENY